MKTKLTESLCALAVLFVLLSCTGSSSFFGDVPDLMYKFSQTAYSLKQEEQTLTSKKEYVEFEQKRAELLNIYTTKIEKAAKAFAGKPLEIRESEDFTVKSPVSFSVSSVGEDMSVYLTVNGEVTAARDINVTDEMSDRYVSFFLVGLNKKKTSWGGIAMFVGRIYPEKVGDEYIVRAGTPVEFEGAVLRQFDCEEYMGVQVFEMAMKDPNYDY